ncbi:hypothetical protein B5M09_006389 [Aphanomyces astaci]|uniref:Uncharacterized protein n=1 Tax=Aphanomyces astaci TaxID=112090 RepID=A0A425DDE6_APHAT|nr:hypothetical protein B5M09_006389 [Aphanomyces astaci]
MMLHILRCLQSHGYYLFQGIDITGDSVGKDVLLFEQREPTTTRMMAISVNANCLLRLIGAPDEVVAITKACLDYHFTPKGVLLSPKVVQERGIRLQDLRNSLALMRAENSAVLGVKPRPSSPSKAKTETSPTTSGSALSSQSSTSDDKENVVVLHGSTDIPSKKRRLMPLLAPTRLDKGNGLVKENVCLPSPASSSQCDTNNVSSTKSKYDAIRDDVDLACNDRAGTDIMPQVEALEDQLYHDDDDNMLEEARSLTLPALKKRLREYAVWVKLHDEDRQLLQFSNQVYLQQINELQQKHIALHKEVSAARQKVADIVRPKMMHV